MYVFIQIVPMFTFANGWNCVSFYEMVKWARRIPGLFDGWKSSRSYDANFQHSICWICCRIIVLSSDGWPSCLTRGKKHRVQLFSDTARFCYWTWLYRLVDCMYRQDVEECRQHPTADGGVAWCVKKEKTMARRFSVSTNKPKKCDKR